MRRARAIMAYRMSLARERESKDGPDNERDMRVTAAGATKNDQKAFSFLVERTFTVVCSNFKLDIQRFRARGVFDKTLQ